MRIPYYPSRESRLKRLLEVFEPEPGSSIADLGSGDGRVLRIIASKFDDIELYGYEKDPLLVDVSRRLSEGYGNIHFFNMDLFSVDLSKHDIIYSYLTPEALGRLRNKAIEFIEDGGIWIALDYRIPNVKPSVVIELDKWHRYYIYSGNREKLYKVFKI